jgi:hypothetical protein
LIPFLTHGIGTIPNAFFRGGAGKRNVMTTTATEIMRLRAAGTVPWAAMADTEIGFVAFIAMVRCFGAAVRGQVDAQNPNVIEPIGAAKYSMPFMYRSKLARIAGELTAQQKLDFANAGHAKYLVNLVNSVVSDQVHCAVCNLVPGAHGAIEPGLFGSWGYKNTLGVTKKPSFADWALGSLNGDDVIQDWAIGQAVGLYDRLDTDHAVIFELRCLAGRGFSGWSDWIKFGAAFAAWFNGQNFDAQIANPVTTNPVAFPYANMGAVPALTGAGGTCHGVAAAVVPAYP